MTFVVAGATGKVGREVVRALIECAAPVRVIARSRARADSLPAGIEIAIGDLEDRASIERAVRGAEAVFFVTPHHEREEALGFAFIEACEAARVRRIVFASAYRPEPGIAMLGAAWLRVLGVIGGHYRPKLHVEARVRASRADPVVLMPSNFFQNDELVRDEILAGRYLQPIGAKGINRVDCRDIGDAAARVLVGRDVRSGGYPVVGPASLTGEQCAAAWTGALGRTVRYGSDDLDAWERAVADRMTAGERSDYRKTYGILQRFGVATKPSDVARCAALLGRAPRSYAEYVRDAANRWRA